MSYWQLYYHFVWSTKNRSPSLTPQVEPVIFSLIRKKAVGLGGTVFGLNGEVDHAHLVCAVPPTISLSSFIGKVKGATSATYNKGSAGAEHFDWQDGYGVFSFDGKRLPSYLGYVQRQKEHHAQGSIIPILERCDTQHESASHEPSPLYLLEDEDWRREMEELSISMCGE